MTMEKNRKLSDAEAQHLEADQSDSSSSHEDAVFGKITEGGPNYRSVGWVGTAGLMVKTQIGLGVLSFPAAFDVLGLIPGIICLLTVAIITTWSGYMVGVFKINHREVYGIDDAGFLMFGRAGKEILAATYCLFYTFCAASALIGISIGLNAVSHHATCTAVFVVVGALVTFALASIRTLGKLTWLAWGGLICIIAAVLIVTFAVGFQDQPAAAPVPWTPDFKLFKAPPFHSAISAVSIMCFAYAGTPAFFALAAEMREPRHYVRSLVLCQGTVTAIYIAVSTVVYYYCGSYVASPALGSAGNKMKIVAYAVSLPGLFVTATVLAHIPAKFIFVRVLRGSRHLTESTPTHWMTWLGCTFGITMVAYVVASGIPIFEDLVSLVGALLGTVVSFQPMGCMWLYDNWKAQRTTKWKAMVCWSAFVIVAGTFLTIAGTYGSVVAIIDDKSKAGGSKVWSCADNSNST